MGKLKLVDLSEHRSAPQVTGAAPVRATMLALDHEGLIQVRLPDGRECGCEWLETGVGLSSPLVAGDTLLVLPPSIAGAAVVLGRVGRYDPARASATAVLETTESLSLKCGEASIDLRADGKVMIRGDDVLVRAKGTQRIRAGTVAIN